MNSKRIRTRYAPSPTGKMHVGNLRTALYEYLIAKHEGGDFLLRIEDTDQERFVEGAVEIVKRTLETAGIIYDEGPDKDGGFGPYTQSERKDQGIYMKYAMELVEKGQAYYCFCDKETLDEKRKVAENNKTTYRYDKHCLDLSKEEIEKNLAENLPFVIRQNNPTEGSTTFVDEIFGKISVDNTELDDMILMKSDGYPTYNFANVVDDHLMEITHVVRGNEYLSSSPKYNRLYEAFGWEVPVYVHCPLITNEEHQKLSKRSGHSSFEDLLEQGFLPEAIVNFVTLLGWSPSSNQEIFTLEELIENFDYKHISKSPAVFDMKKFRWMNSEYIKNMPFDKFYELALPRLKDHVKNESLDLKKIATIIQSRLEVMNDIDGIVDFFDTVPEYEVSLYKHKRMKTNPENSFEYLSALLPVLENHEDWTLDSLHDLVLGYVADQGMKNGQILWPLRTALSGKMSTPGGAFDLADILGKEESINRIKAAIVKLENEK